MNNNTSCNIKAKKVYDFFRYHGIINGMQMISVILEVIRAKETIKGNSFDVEDNCKCMEALAFKIKNTSCDKEFLVRLHGLLDGWDEYTYVTFLNLLDEGRNMIIPQTLLNVFLEHITTQVKSVLITEVEKYGPDLLKVIKKYPEVTFTLTFRDHLWSDLLNEICCKHTNINFIDSDIYAYEFTAEKFDLIIAVPTFGGRMLIKESDFISKEPDLIAVQNLLYHLNIDGELIIVLPAKITFAGGSTQDLRNYIEKNYKIKEVNFLPPGLFSPYTGIKTYLFVFSTGVTDDVVVKKYEAEKPLRKTLAFEKLVLTNEQLLFNEEFKQPNGWNFDMAFWTEDEDIKAFTDSYVKKMPLKQVADVFRGKAVNSKSEDGNIGIINISNMNEFGIDYSCLEFFEEEERNVYKYALKEGDVLVTARGTTIKISVFKEQDYICIPSVNINVIRPGDALDGTYLKLFLESPVGTKMLKSLQRGEGIMNINYKDMSELEVPVLELETQKTIVREYIEGLNLYRQTIAAAEEGWKGLMLDIQSKLY